MIGELEIGDIIEVCKLRLQCRENITGSCANCYWYVGEDQCEDVHNSCGPCTSFLRTDNKDVIFVKVGEVPDA